MKVYGVVSKDGDRKQYDAMTFIEYLPMALKTESKDMVAIRSRFDNDQSIRLLHAVLGMTTEAVELGRAMHRLDVATSEENIVNFCEEVGDVFWYVAVFVDAWRVNFDIEIPFKFDLISVSVVSDKHHERPIDVLYAVVGSMADAVKRHVYYGEELSQTACATYINDGYNALMSIVSQYAPITDKKYSVLLNDNIMKLKKRFGDKFDEKLALNRNVKKELDHM